MFQDSFKPVFLILHPLPNTIKAWINYKGVNKEMYCFTEMQNLANRPTLIPLNK